jgi:hypothetical protein
VFLMYLCRVMKTGMNGNTYLLMQHWLDWRSTVCSSYCSSHLLMTTVCARGVESRRGERGGGVFQVLVSRAPSCTAAAAAAAYITAAIYCC